MFNYGKGSCFCGIFVLLDVKANVVQDKEAYANVFRTIFCIRLICMRLLTVSTLSLPYEFKNSF